MHFSLVVDFEMLLHTEGKDENFRQISGNCSLFFFQYFMTMLCSLAVVAWIGQQVHNLFLTYLIGKCVTCKTDPTVSCLKWCEAGGGEMSLFVWGCFFFLTWDIYLCVQTADGD